MRVLMVGGAGGVGTMIRPALEADHEVTVFDRVAVDGIGERSIVADTGDDEAVARAIVGVDAVIYMPMGIGSNGDVSELDPAFDVNLRDFYRLLMHGFEAGVMRYVYTSSMSVHKNLWSIGRIDESRPPDEWHPYGMSKRLAERLCAIAARREPRATIVALRLSMPRTEDDIRKALRRRPVFSPATYTPTHDARAIFLAALACSRPGAHVVQATGDVEGKLYPNDRATELLGYRATGLRSIPR